jgi:hypothetical protein
MSRTSQKLYLVSSNVESEMYVSGYEEWDARDKAKEYLEKKHFTQQVVIKTVEWVGDSESNRSKRIFIP